MKLTSILLTSAATCLTLGAASSAGAQGTAAAPPPRAAAGTASPASPAAAPASPTPAGQVSEVVVTATRRATNLQTTGADITALSADTLRAKSVSTFEDLGRIAPGVQVSTSEGFAQVYIRGIGTPLRGAGLGEGSTALLTDGVYLANAADAATSYYDVSRIEVLSGPQGTLYGRNATSGAVNVITNNPTEDFQGYGRETVGNYDRTTEQGAISGPIYGDQVLGRLAFIRNDHDGYEKLIYPDGHTSDAEDQHDMGVRGKLEIKPAAAPDLDVLLTGDYYNANDRAVDYHFLGSGYKTNAAYQARLATSTDISTPFSRTQYTDVPFYNRRNIGGLTSNISYKLDGYTLQSVTAYRIVDFQYQNDLGFGTTQTATQHHGENAHQISQDLLLTSPSHQFFEWIAGYSFFHQQDELLINYNIPTAGLIGSLNVKRAPLFSQNSPGCCLLDLSGGSRNTSNSGFVDGTLNLTDRLKIHGGARYTAEEIGGYQHVGVGDGAVFAPFNVVPELAPKTFYSFTPKAEADYRFTHNIFGYFSFTKGFKTGGYNIGDFAQNKAFNPERISSYEVGLKTDWFDKRLTANLTGFDYQYKDLQVQQTINNSVQILNAATARVRGVEFETTYRPLPLTEVDASVVALNAVFTDFDTADPNRPALGVLNRSNSSLPKAPDTSIDLGAQQGVQVADFGIATLRFDYSHKSKTYQDIYSTPGLTVGPTDLFNGRLSFVPSRGRWDAALYVENAGDAKFATNAFYGGGVIGTEALGQLTPPRTYGVEFGYRF